jgi:septal ring-binding cell division protein DamX
MFERVNEAREIAKEIQGPFNPSVLSTPYALEIDVFSSRETADQEKEKWERKGYYPYLLPIPGGQQFRLLLGAFATSQECVTLSQQLSAEGIIFQVVRR